MTDKMKSALSLARSVLASKGPWYAIVGALAAAVIVLSSCAGPAVAVVEFEGKGEVRTDGDHVLATGKVDGAIRAFAKGSGFPLYFLPILAGDGMVWAAVISDGTYGLYDPEHLPAWAVELYEPPDGPFPPQD